MYAITAQIEHTTADGWTGSTGVPTFYLDERVQGILNSEDAINVAREILNAREREEMFGQRVHISAVKVSNNDDDATNQYPADLIPDLFGGQVLIALMDDGGALCERCVRDETNPVHVADQDNRDGWGIVGWDGSSNYEEHTACDHCGRVLVEGEPVASCPACGQPIDYCQGHGEIGDPEGALILAAHDEGNHQWCHADGCDDAGS